MGVNETGYEPDSEREERLLVLHARMHRDGCCSYVI